MELLIWNVNTLKPQLSFQYPLVGSHTGATLYTIGIINGRRNFWYYYALAGLHDKTSLQYKAYHARWVFVQMVLQFSSTNNY